MADGGRAVEVQMAGVRVRAARSRRVVLGVLVASLLAVAGCGSGGTGSAAVGAPAPASGAGSSTTVGANPTSGEWSAMAGDTFAGASLYDVSVYGGGFVTVGSASAADQQQVGGVWTSSDGSGWKAAGPPSTFMDATVAVATAAGDGIVAVGTPCSGECFGFESWSTPDGETWSGPLKVSGAEAVTPTGIVAGHDIVVAIGNDLADVSNGRFNGSVFTTTDGKAWSAVPDIAAMHDARLEAIAAGTSGFVIVGSTTTAAGRSAAAWSSPDGTTWTRAPDSPSFVGATLASVAIGGPGYVAVGSIGPDGAVWASPDGQMWTRSDQQGTFAGSPLVDIATNGNGFVTIGGDASGGTVWTSIDGAAWTPTPAIPGSAGMHFKSVAAGPKATVIVGKPGPSAADAGLVWFGPAP